MKEFPEKSNGFLDFLRCSRLGRTYGCLLSMTEALLWARELYRKSVEVKKNFRIYDPSSVSSFPVFAPSRRKNRSKDILLFGSGIRRPLRCKKSKSVRFHRSGILNAIACAPQASIIASISRPTSSISAAPFFRFMMATRRRWPYGPYAFGSHPMTLKRNSPLLVELPHLRKLKTSCSKWFPHRIFLRISS